MLEGFKRKKKTEWAKYVEYTWVQKEKGKKVMQSLYEVAPVYDNVYT